MLPKGQAVQKTWMGSIPGPTIPMIFNTQGAWLGLLALASLQAAPAAQASSASSESDPLLQWLDRDGDGQIGAYEGADAWLQLTEEADRDHSGGLDAAEIASHFKQLQLEQDKELEDIFEELDRNQDGALSSPELPSEWRPLLLQADTDQDHNLDFGEFQAAQGLGDPAMAFELELVEFFEDVDGDGDGQFSLAELPVEEHADWAPRFERLDRNTDGFLDRAELLQLAQEERQGAQFDVHGKRAEMHGVIGPSTPGRVLQLILEHPEVKTIVMRDVPGSMDDDSNLRAARWVRRMGFSTHVPMGGMVASGGTDFFQAGVQRTAAPDARFGVHSWSGFDEEGAELPRDHPEHEKYVEYCRQMGIPESFYWYTLEAAPSSGIHWMSAAELARYRMLTQEPEGAGAASPKPGSLEHELGEMGLESLLFLPLDDTGQLDPESLASHPELAPLGELWDSMRRRLPGAARAALPQIRGLRIVQGDDAAPGMATPLRDELSGPWEIAISKKALSEPDLGWVLAHEYAHVLSIGDPGIQIEEDPLMRPSGPRFGEFYGRFWVQNGFAERLARLNAAASQDPEIEQRVIESMQRDRLVFVSEFAMVSPEEDFAESFAEYIWERPGEDNECIQDGGQAKLKWLERIYPRDAANRE